MTVLPAGSNGEARFDPFQPILNLAQGDNSNPNLLAQQAATVTAVTRDGFESGNSHQTYAGLPTAPPSLGNTHSLANTPSVGNAPVVSVNSGYHALPYVLGM